MNNNTLYSASKDTDNKDYRRYFLNNLDPDTKIYKYIPLKYVAEMYRSGKYILNQVKSWEDVYENYILKQNLLDSNNRPVISKEVAESIYGQSWSTLPESDAMWRIYSHDKQAIKIRTTARKLLNLFPSQNKLVSHIANVDYQPQQNIDNILANIEKTRQELSNIGSLDFFILDSLITKRTEFKHEEEVRIIVRREYTPHDFEIPTHIEAEFSPNDFFEELVIDPRADDITVRNAIDLLKAVGAEPIKISQSPLYTLNKYTLHL